MKPRGAVGQVLLAFLFVGMGGPLCAQEPDAVRKITLPSLDAQVRAELAALDRRLSAVQTPSLAAAIVGQIAPPGQALAALGLILTDPQNKESWAQLPEAYYKMALDSGDALVAMPDELDRGPAWSSGQVRRICMQRLTLLPRTALHWYRQRVDAEAKALLEQGRRTRSAAPLRRLVDELFCSTVGDQALDLLGDLAFERGQFEEARSWWAQLAPLDADVGDRLRFPDPTVDLVRVEAKLILALIFQGRVDDAQAGMTRFERRHPQAAGGLAAETGRYGDILRKTFASFTQSQPVTQEEPGPTFGGTATRNGVLANDLPWRLWEDGPSWRVPLPALSTGAAREAHRLGLARRTAFHPIILEQQVLLADHRSIVSYHLATGKELFRFSLKNAGLIDPGSGVDARIALPRFTLSAEDGRVYARLGSLSTGAQKLAAKAAASYLVCLDATEPEANRPRLIWQVAARVEDKTQSWFEGSPLVHDRLVYAALAKRAGGRIVTSIVCYDTKGRQRWAREVCDCPEREDAASSLREQQHLLTWTGGQIVYCSHAGAIVAVDAWTGQPTWGVRYEPRNASAMRLPAPARELVPCVYADGLIYAAPHDSSCIFCIESQTGQGRWTLDDADAIHLLGVAQNRLVFTTRDGVQAVEATTGRNEWGQPGQGSLPGLGRGLIAGGSLYWPTADDRLPYRILTLANGQQPRDPTQLYHLPAGNWAYGQGCLAIAGVDELVVFARPSPARPPFDPRPQARVDGPYRPGRSAAGQAIK